ncbi:MAG: DUF1320 family protein [Prevotella sp.]|nr:DUF1320 family protein [Prevotella sp.]
MILTAEDYKVVIGEAGLKAVSQVSEENVRKAEGEAQEEMAGYLRPKYDVGAIFAAEGDQRNALIVMYLCDISLYHLSASLPQKMGAEVRKERYDRAIKWLEGVQAGRIVPDLPLPVDENGDTVAAGTVVFHSNKKLKHEW